MNTGARFLYHISGFLCCFFCLSLLLIFLVLIFTWTWRIRSRLIQRRNFYGPLPPDDDRRKGYILLHRGPYSSGTNWVFESRKTAYTNLSPRHDGTYFSFFHLGRLESFFIFHLFLQLLYPGLSLSCYASVERKKLLSRPPFFSFGTVLTEIHQPNTPPLTFPRPLPLLPSTRKWALFLLSFRWGNVLLAGNDGLEPAWVGLAFGPGKGWGEWLFFLGVGVWRRGTVYGAHLAGAVAGFSDGGRLEDWSWMGGRL